MQNLRYLEASKFLCPILNQAGRKLLHMQTSNVIYRLIINTSAVQCVYSHLSLVITLQIETSSCHQWLAYNGSLSSNCTWQMANHLLSLDQTMIRWRDFRPHCRPAWSHPIPTFFYILTPSSPHYCTVIAVGETQHMLGWAVSTH